MERRQAPVASPGPLHLGFTSVRIATEGIESSYEGTQVAGQNSRVLGPG
jgi:hypothetical protein